MKINSVYQYGLNSLGDEGTAAGLIEKTVSGVTGLNFNYFAVLNFDGFTRVIDAVGGVNVMNERDILDKSYPGPNYSYETFSLEKGFHHLDGATALKYARERHDDPLGDFGRAARQQQIIEAAKNRVFSTKTLLDVFALSEIFDAIGDNLVSDIAPKEIESFLELARRLDTANATNAVADAWSPESLLKVSHIETGRGRAFVLIPRVGNYSEIQELAGNIFDLDLINRRKDAIVKENATVAIVDRSGAPGLLSRIKKLLGENFGYKNITVISNDPKIIADQTTAYDLHNGAAPFTLDELVKKIPARAAYDLPGEFTDAAGEAEADIILVLGKDLAERYNMEEDSVEDYKNSDDMDEYTEFRTTD